MHCCCWRLCLDGSAWLRDDEDTRIQLLSQRARASMNLTLDTVEELQVLHTLLHAHTLHSTKKLCWEIMLVLRIWDQVGMQLFYFKHLPGPEPQIDAYWGIEDSFVHSIQLGWWLDWYGTAAITAADFFLILLQTHTFPLCLSQVGCYVHTSDGKQNLI